MEWKGIATASSEFGFIILSFYVLLYPNHLLSSKSMAKRVQNVVITFHIFVKVDFIIVTSNGMKTYVFPYGFDDTSVVFLSVSILLNDDVT